MKKTCPLLTLIALLAVGCTKEVPLEPAPIRPAQTLRVTAPEAQITRTFSGQVTASETSGVAFQVNGRVIELIAKAGESYKMGDVLARLDAADYTSQLNDAEGRMTEARKARIRTQGLFENGSASESQFESATTAEKSAQAALETAKKRVDDCTLTMPYDGVIGRVDIRAQETVPAGQAVMSILSNGGSLEFNIGVPADIIDEIKKGANGSLTIGSISDKVFDATVTEIGGEPASNTTYPVTLSFAAQHSGVREGMDGEAALTFPNPAGEVITVPLSCVAALPGDASYVLLVDPVDGQEDRATVRRQEVKTGGIRGEGRIEILEGIKENDRMVSRGVHRLEPGTEVLLTNESATK